MHRLASKLMFRSRLLGTSSGPSLFSTPKVGPNILVRSTARESIRNSKSIWTKCTRSLSTASDQGFKPWETSMIECHGDYREESHLEKHIGGPLYENQSDLPRLPIPEIGETVERFLSTALPLARTTEESTALLQACEKFPEQAQILQERLQYRKDNDMKDSSWLQQWWNQLAYLQYRGSVVVNVSYFFQFKDDPTTDNAPGVANIQRAATLLFASAEFRKKVCSGDLPTDRIGKQQIPLCSTPYKFMFNSCRIPQPEQDVCRIYDPSLYSHAIVARKGHFFAIEFVDEATGDPLPLSTIEAQLEMCIEMADKIPSEQTQLGLLTSSNRDTWTAARETLCKEGGLEMENALEKIESSALLVCLDDHLPQSRKECGESMLTGGTTSGNNRWFDKTIQLIVAENGKSGIQGEHSMMDGMVLVNLSDYITNTSYEDAKARSSPPGKVPKVENVFGPVVGKVHPSTLDTLLDKAADEFEDLTSAQSLSVQSFQGYGSSYIKQAGFSPDAYVQMAMQLATFRLFGEQVGTYEAAQVRPFLHGRTETARSVSQESAAFVKAMGPRPQMDEHDNAKRKQKLKLMKEAAAAHSKYTGTAAQAAGVDRHFFGLSMLVEDGEETPDLLNDPVFVRSKTWRLSTSHLTHPNFVNWGFGQVVPDGVGVAYSIHPQSCTFNISALAETNWTSKLSDLLEEALLEMQRLVDYERKEDTALAQ